MTREEAKQLLPIIKAFSEGKVIETRTKPSVLNNPAIPNEWTEMKELEYWSNTEYRIKPETKYRPFKDAEECWQEMQEHQPFGWIIYKMKPTVIRSIASLYDDGVEPYDACNSSYKEALQIFTFADGEPFGVKVIN